MPATNTGDKQPNRGAFKKGDPRINRNGRPKSFDKLRELARSISHEPIVQAGQPLVIDGHIVTVAEAMLRQLATSKNPRDRQLFIEIAYGKVPNPVEISGKDGGPVNIQMTWGDNDSGDDGASPD